MYPLQQRLVDHTLDARSQKDSKPHLLQQHGAGVGISVGIGVSVEILIEILDQYLLSSWSGSILLLFSPQLLILILPLLLSAALLLEVDFVGGTRSPSHVVFVVVIVSFTMTLTTFMTTILITKITVMMALTLFVLMTTWNHFYESESKSESVKNCKLERNNQSELRLTRVLRFRNSFTFKEK